jgi:hypothetical protein
MANRKPNLLLVVAAAACGPHRFFRDAIMALRNHPDPRIAKLANGCTVTSLENRLRPYQEEMMQRWPPATGGSLSPLAMRALDIVSHFERSHLENPEIRGAYFDLVRHLIWSAVKPS